MISMTMPLPTQRPCSGGSKPLSAPVGVGLNEVTPEAGIWRVSPLLPAGTAAGARAIVPATTARTTDQIVRLYLTTPTSSVQSPRPWVEAPLSVDAKFGRARASN